MRALDDILQRMPAHQSKQRPLPRALKSWDLGAEPAAPVPARRIHRAAAPDTEALSPVQ